MSESNILANHSFKWMLDKGFISSETFKCLTCQQLQFPTKIQLHSFPSLISKQNVFLRAKTGSGKTLAFLIPAIERLKTMKFQVSMGTGAIIISPTRELALQISIVAKTLCESHGFTYVTLIGGTKHADISILNKSTIVIATPGRLADVMKRNNGQALKLSKLKLFILDEADRLLDGSSKTLAIKEIIKSINLDGLQKILVSATVDEKSVKIAEEILKTNFIVVSTKTDDKSAPPDHISQNCITVATKDRLTMLITVLNTMKKEKTIVFFNTCNSVKYHYQLLLKFGLPVSFCVGKEAQSKRSTKYSTFYKAKQGILLATGLAERGWDIPKVSWVIQYDPSHQPEDYVHRVGRTGRGESLSGNALLFLCPHEEGFIQHLTKFNVHLKKIVFEGNLEEIDRQVKQHVSEDTTLQNLANKSYQSTLRAYRCYKLKSIFSFKKLDLNDLGQSFGLQK